MAAAARLAFGQAPKTGQFLTKSFFERALFLQLAGGGASGGGPGQISEGFLLEIN